MVDTHFHPVNTNLSYDQAKVLASRGFVGDLGQFVTFCDIRMWDFG